MKNILYITTQDIGIPQGIGVKKKIFSQLESFTKNGLKSYLIAFDKGDIVLIEDIKKTNIIKKSNEFKIKRLNFYKSIESVVRKESIDCIYIRYFYSDPLFISLLKKCRKLCSKTLIEVPTYPYDGELSKNLKGNIIKNIDKLYSKQLEKYVDYIITFSNHDKVFGIKTINIENGVNVNSIKKRKINTKTNKSELRLIGVANLSFWHGFDRVIEGLREYYKNNADKKVYFDIVGEGSEKVNLEKLVMKYKLDKYVTFKGMMRGESLDLIFNQADIAIGSLGIHRLGLDSVSTLKSKEYFARGIPFVYAYKENFLDMLDETYTFKMKSNDMPIDINVLVEKYNEIDNIEKMSYDMRVFAENYLTWDYQIEKIMKEVIG